MSRRSIDSHIQNRQTINLCFVGQIFLFLTMVLTLKTIESSFAPKYRKLSVSKLGQVKKCRINTG